MTTLEQIESRLSVCAKATPGPWGENSGCASDTGLELFVTCDEHHETVAKVYTMGDREFIAASRNQREGELAALKVAVEAFERIFEICDETDELNGKRLAREALAQITKLMGEA